MLENLQELTLEIIRNKTILLFASLGAFKLLLAASGRKRGPRGVKK